MGEVSSELVNGIRKLREHQAALRKEEAEADAVAGQFIRLLNDGPMKEEAAHQWFSDHGVPRHLADYVLRKRMLKGEVVNFSAEGAYRLP